MLDFCQSRNKFPASRHCSNLNVRIFSSFTVPRLLIHINRALMRNIISKDIKNASVIKLLFYELSHYAINKESCIWFNIGKMNNPTSLLINDWHCIRKWIQLSMNLRHYVFLTWYFASGVNCWCVNYNCICFFLFIRICSMR